MNTWRNFKDSLMTKDKMKLPNIAIALALGIGLLLAANLFGDSEEQAEDTPYQGVINQSPTTDQLPTSHEAYLERRLEAILRTVDGVGNVRVMVTLSARSARVYAENVVRSESSTTESDSAGGQREQADTTSQQTLVTINAQGGYQQPILVREYEPSVEGVIISAQGARDPRIRAELIAAAQTALGVGPNRVQVLVMSQ